MKPGDLIFFDGSGDADVLDLVDHFLSNAIEVLTGCDWSHVAMVRDEDNIVESSIINHRSGPQVNSIASRINGYDGVSVWLFPLKDLVRDRIDFAAMWTFADSRIGRDRYSVRSLVDFVLRPLLPFIPALRRSHPGEEVCSEFVVQLLQAGGLFPGLNPHECSPKTIAALPIFGIPQKIFSEAKK